MKDLPEVLRLVRIPASEGTLYLYPEYRELAARLDLSKACKTKTHSGRETMRCKDIDDIIEFMAKPERLPDDDERRERAGCWGSIPREITVARSLSQLASYEDDSLKVTFEEPLGYFEAPDGTRTGLFKYHSLLTSQNSSFTDIFQQFDRELERRGSVRENLFFPLLKLLGGYSDVPWKEEDWLEKNRFLGVFLEGLYRPKWIAEVFMLHQGVYHYDPMFNIIPYHEDKQAFHVIDFEFTYLRDKYPNWQIKHAQELQLENTCFEDVQFPEPWLDIATKFSPVQQRQQILQTIKELREKRKRTVDTYLSQVGNFADADVDGQQYGKAYALLRHINNLNHDALIITS